MSKEYEVSVRAAKGSPGPPSLEQRLAALRAWRKDVASGEYLVRLDGEIVGLEQRIRDEKGRVERKRRRAERSVTAEVMAKVEIEAIVKARAQLRAEAEADAARVVAEARARVEAEAKALEARRMELREMEVVLQTERVRLGFEEGQKARAQADADAAALGSAVAKIERIWQRLNPDQHPPIQRLELIIWGLKQPRDYVLALTNAEITAILADAEAWARGNTSAQLTLSMLQGSWALREGDPQPAEVSDAVLDELRRIQQEADATPSIR
jgi:hypothetical protein